MTDNGGMLGSHVYNAGLREGKGSIYDGGHRIVCFMRGPAGRFGTPRDIAVPTQIQDLLPTLIGICGLPIPEKTRFDGKDLAPLLLGKGELADRMFVVQYGGRIRPQKYDGSVVWNKWRLVNGVELFNMDVDPGQRTDISAQYPEVVAKMKAFYEQWWAELQAGLDDFIPVPVGSSHANPVFLTSNNWQEVDVDNWRRVGEAAGGPRGGAWNIQVELAGPYEIELRRWPFHTGFAIGSDGPQKTVFGRPLSHAGKRIPAESAVLMAMGKEHEVHLSPADLGAVLHIKLDVGRQKIQGWFRDARKVDLCGAFYARVTAL